MARRWALTKVRGLGHDHWNAFEVGYAHPDLKDKKICPGHPSEQKPRHREQRTPLDLHDVPVRILRPKLVHMKRMHAEQDGWRYTQLKCRD